MITRQTPVPPIRVRMIRGSEISGRKVLVETHGRKAIEIGKKKKRPRHTPESKKYHTRV